MMFTARTNKRLLHATKTAAAAAAVVTICIPITWIGVTGYSNLLPDRSRLYTDSKTFVARAASITRKSIFKVSRINKNDFCLSSTYKYFALLKLPVFFTSSQCNCESISHHEDEKSDNDNSPTVASVPNTKRSSKVTEAATYYEKYGELPEPPIMHALFDEMIQMPKKNDAGKKNITILIIGDIHGCYDELQLLINNATKEYNNGNNFDYIISVGDLVNKGPKSVEVIQQFRTIPNFYAIRGNHDNAAIQSYLKGGVKSNKYLWIDQLTDSDIEWMLELPYSIRIPHSIVYGDDDDDDASDSASSSNVNNNNKNDTIIVHAGLVPNQDLFDQNLDSMVFIRDVAAVVVAGGNDIDQQQKQKVTTSSSSSSSSNSQNDKKTQLPTYVDYYRHIQYSDPTTTSTFDVSSPVPWASAYNGPYNVIFGHDAKRGIQQYTNNNDYYTNNNEHADTVQSNNDSQATTTTSNNTNTNTSTVQIIGLDSGCCYGNQLTGLVVPGHKIVQVNATKVHCPIIY